MEQLKDGQPRRKKTIGGNLSFLSTFDFGFTRETLFIYEINPDSYLN